MLTNTASTDATDSHAAPISNPLGHPYAQERFFADTHDGSLRSLQGLLLWSSCMEMRKCRLRSQTALRWKNLETRPPSQQPRSSHELGILAIQETNKTSNRGKPPKKEQKQLGAMKRRREISERSVCTGHLLK